MRHESPPASERRSASGPSSPRLPAPPCTQVMGAVAPPAPLPALALRARPTYICAPLPTCELRQMQRTACQLLARPDYARVLVAHDAGGGVWSGEAARAWAATAPECQPAA